MLLTYFFKLGNKAVFIGLFISSVHAQSDKLPV